VRRDLLDLKERIESELFNVEKAAQRALGAWEEASHNTDQKDYYLDSVALNLQSFYNGLERIFSVIARQLDPDFPSGERWHRDLLEQMSREVPESRPAVLSNRAIDVLSEFLAFRHVVRGIYAFELEEERLYSLVELLPEAMSGVRKELERFCRLLLLASDQDAKWESESSF